MIEIEQFDPSKTYHELRKFNCRHPGIDKFVRDNLKKQVASGHAIAWVLLDTANSDKFVAFYTLTMSEVLRDKLQSKISGSMPARLGCMRLVMLGVDAQHQKSPQKLGVRLMKQALQQTKEAAKFGGCRGLYLDADAGALNFYTKLGFTALEAPQTPSDPTPMFLPIESFF